MPNIIASPDRIYCALQMLSETNDQEENRVTTIMLMQMIKYMRTLPLGNNFPLGYIDHEPKALPFLLDDLKSANSQDKPGIQQQCLLAFLEHYMTKKETRFRAFKVLSECTLFMKVAEDITSRQIVESLSDKITDICLEIVEIEGVLPKQDFTQNMSAKELPPDSKFRHYSDSD